MKHSLILYGVLFQIVHATSALTQLEQTILTEKLTQLIEQEHAHGHIPGDYPAASISVKVGFEEQESFVECICNVYLENQNETTFLIQGTSKVPWNKIHTLKHSDHKKIGKIKWHLNTTALLRKTRIAFLKDFEKKMLKNIEMVMRNDIASGKTTFTPSGKYKITVTPQYAPKDIASLYNPEEPVVRAIPNTYLVEIFNQDGSSAGLARMIMEEKEIRDFLKRAGVKTVHSK
ncbi:hypothetical protein EBR77_03885 [bacterium]|nr:hypothetical protein [bacterium]NBX78727.1 hypothetical protein [bacterium]